MTNKSLETMLKETQSLVNGDIVSTELNSILLGFCELINSQNEEIQSLKTELKTLISQDNLKSALDGRNRQILELQSDINIFKEEMKTDFLRIKFDSDSIRSKFDEKYGQTSEKLKSLEKSIDNQIHSLSLQNAQNDSRTKDKVTEIVENNKSIFVEFEHIKSSLDKFGLSTVDKILEKLDLIEKRIDGNENSIQEIDENSKKENVQLAKNSEVIKKSLDSELKFIKERVTDLEKQFASTPELSEMIINGDEIGLSQILQTVMRDSRRLDSFDQQVSSVRNECENVANSMISMNQTIQKFNHQIFDFGLEIKNNSAQISKEIDQIKFFIRFAGRTISDMMTDMTRMADAHYHLCSTTTLSVDELTHLIGNLVGRNFRNASTLDEVSLEANSLNQEISQKRLNLDMAKKLQIIDGKHIEEMKDIQQLETPQYEKVMQEFKYSKRFQQSPDSNSTENDEINLSSPSPTAQAANIAAAVVENDPLVILSLEELRVQVNDISKIVDSLNENVKIQLENYRKEINKKMDSNSIDRIITKVQNSLKKMQNEILEIQNPEAIVLSGLQNESPRNLSRHALSETASISSCMTAKSISTMPGTTATNNTSSNNNNAAANVLNRPSTATPISFMSAKAKAKMNGTNNREPHSQRRQKMEQNSVPIIQKASVKKLASCFISNQRENF